MVRKTTVMGTPVQPVGTKFSVDSGGPVGPVECKSGPSAAFWFRVWLATCAFGIFMAMYIGAIQPGFASENACTYLRIRNPRPGPGDLILFHARTCMPALGHGSIVIGAIADDPDGDDNDGTGLSTLWDGENDEADGAGSDGERRTLNDALPKDPATTVSPATTAPPATAPQATTPASPATTPVTAEPR